jgi:hypothetical protein
MVKWLLAKPSKAFKPREYLISDLGYTATPTVLSANQSNNVDDPNNENEGERIARFNTYLA